jgi:hypothetical protein
MSRDTKLLNAITTGINDKIPSDCAAYEDIQKQSKIGKTALGAATFSLSDYEAYRNDIEFVNKFNEQILLDERNYFVKKYGEKVYNFLLTQRAEFKAEQLKIKEQSMCSVYISDLAALQKKFDEQTVCNTPPLKDSGKFMNYLLSLSTIQNPDTTYRKIEYRNEAHELLSTINLWLTILYFVILGVMLGLLSAANKLLLKERFMLYLFLVVLPFAFPYLFELLKYLYEYLFPNTPNHGPKDAFLEIKTNPMDSFNV